MRITATVVAMFVVTMMVTSLGLKIAANKMEQRFTQSSMKF